MSAEITDEEHKRRVRLGNAMAKTVQSEAETENWHYECQVSPVYTNTVPQKWQISIIGIEKNKPEEEARDRYESFDLETIRAYHKIFREIIEKFDKGEIKNPW